MQAHPQQQENEDENRPPVWEGCFVAEALSVQLPKKQF